MVDYLGEDEPALVAFILGKMEAQAGAEIVEKEIAKVLDDEAEV